METISLTAVGLAGFGQPREAWFGWHWRPRIGAMLEWLARRID